MLMAREIGQLQRWLERQDCMNLPRLGITQAFRPGCAAALCYCRKARDLP